MTEIEQTQQTEIQLSEAQHTALEEWNKLSKLERAAFKKYEAADKAYKEFQLYQKAKRKVMRDIIAAAANMASPAEIMKK